MSERPHVLVIGSGPGGSTTPAILTTARACVYLSAGKLAADRDLRVFDGWQERKMFRQKSRAGAR